MNQNDWEILQTRSASKRKVGDSHTSLSQWHQGIGGHGYVKLGVARGVHFNLYSELRRLSNSIMRPARPVKVKPPVPTRIGVGGNITHERRDASGILLPTAQHRRYVPIPLTTIKGKALNIGFDGKRMD